MARKKKGSIGCLFWIALILLIIVIFLFNKEGISKIVKSSGICKYLPGLPPCDDSQDNEISYSQQEEQQSEENEQTETEGSNALEEYVLDLVSELSAEENENRDSRSENEQPGGPDEQIFQTDISNKKMRTSVIYYVKINEEDDTISLQQVERPVYFIDSPLTETLRSLLSGLSSSEMNNGMLTMIPIGTELKSVAVRNGVAYLDFNQAFTSSQIGREGSIYRLRQIIYTCTEFPTVDKVQFLINGKIQKYLSSDGIYIDEPLGREDI